jgi:predicted methyltransferase
MKLSNVLITTKGDLFGHDLLQATDPLNIIIITVEENIDYIKVIDKDENTIGFIKIK